METAAGPLPTFDPGFSTAEMTLLFSAASRVAAMCRVEGALAAAEADAGLIPAEVAAEIREACALPIEDPEQVLIDGWEAGTPVIPLLARLRTRLGEDAARLLHHGATSQDVVDSALMVQVGAGLEALAASLGALGAGLRSLALAHRETPMVGRTFLQHAEPTTFGVRAALWLDPLIGHLATLRSLRQALPVQLGGPVGNEAPFGDRAAEAIAALAERLALAEPTAPWHTDRSRLAEVVAAVARIAGSTGKIATDLILLAQTDVAEVTMRPGASSSMPGKRNPIDAVRAVAAAQACAAAAQVVAVAPPHLLERGIGSWHSEWFAVPVVFQTAAAAVEACGAAIRSLEVDAAAMAVNLGAPIERAVLQAAGALIDRVLDAAAGLIGGTGD